MADLLLTTETRDDGVTIVTIAGDADVYTSARLREQFIDLTGNGCCLIVLDMSGCEFLDNTGLAVLIGALKRCRYHNGHLAIAAASDAVARVFRITGLTRVFTMAETVDEAALSLLAVSGG